LHTIDQYLAIERAAEERHIYLDGQIYAMAGESGEHGDISANVVGSLVAQLRGKPCRARTKDTKVRSGPTPMPGRSTTGLFSYPDVVVICGEPEYHDAFKDIILNPTAIVEVLSHATEAFDRGDKFLRYQKWNPSLSEYVLVSQDTPQIEHFVKQADGTWTYRVYAGLEAVLIMHSIGCTLKLADAYERVDFGAPG
jgi:Uma2 family endonuclease